MYKKILVPLDGSELAECVLPHLETIVRGCSVPDVIFLRVVEPFQKVSGWESNTLSSIDGISKIDVNKVDAQNRDNAKKYLEELIKRTKLDSASAKTEVLTGAAPETITDYASKNGVDLIVIATHGRSGISRWVWGSVADRILRSACIPVFMVRAPGCVPGI
jgi:nucleotide-binding universal stress UspA family protein